MLMRSYQLRCLTQGCPRAQLELCQSYADALRSGGIALDGLH